MWVPEFASLEWSRRVLNMSVKQHPKPVLATTRLAADLDRIVSAVGNQGMGWRKAPLLRAHLPTISQNPGVYLFLLPRQVLPETRVIILHGRTFGRTSSRRQLQIEFSYQAKLLENSDSMVVYVGKASNIRARIKLHLSTHPQATTNQVLRGLVGKPHTHITRGVLEEAKQTLQANGSIYYMEHFTRIKQLIAG
jgi:hypothetical protein